MAKAKAKKAMCDKCAGSGWKVEGEESCPFCGGTGEK